MLTKPTKIIYIAIIGLILLIDQSIAWNAMKHGRVDQILNHGGIFNSPVSNSFLVVASLLVVIFLLCTNRTTTGELLGASVVVGGAVSNIVDRVLYRGVVDYWQIARLVFNLADVAIIVGILWLIFLLIKSPQ